MVVGFFIPVVWCDLWCSACWFVVGLLGFGLVWMVWFCYSFGFWFMWIVLIWFDLVGLVSVF